MVGKRDAKALLYFADFHDSPFLMVCVVLLVFGRSAVKVWARGMCTTTHRWNWTSLSPYLTVNERIVVVSALSFAFDGHKSRTVIVAAFAFFYPPYSHRSVSLHLSSFGYAFSKSVQKLILREFSSRIVTISIAIWAYSSAALVTRTNTLATNTHTHSHHHVNVFENSR